MISTFVKTGIAAALVFAASAISGSAQDQEPLPDYVLGDVDAPIEIIEYASFTCPHCAAFHENVYPKLKADYVETGKVKFVFREIYFDRFGLWAGMLARCGGEDRYFGIVDLLFEKQAFWSRGDDAAEIVGKMYQVGRQAGLDDSTMESCMQDQETAKALVADYQLKAGGHEITATPTFIIDGEKVSNMPYADFVKLLDEKLN